MGSITGINWSAIAAVPNGSSCPALSPSTTTTTNQTNNSTSQNKVVSKPYRLKNYCSQTENYDTLHRKVAQVQSLSLYHVLLEASYFFFFIVSGSK